MEKQQKKEIQKTALRIILADEYETYDQALIVTARFTNS